MSNIVSYQPPLIPEDNPFDAIKHVYADGSESWSARELMPLLGYTTWQFFKPVIAKAKESCKTNGQVIRSHFMQSHDDLATKQGAQRTIEDIRLSRLRETRIQKGRHCADLFKRDHPLTTRYWTPTEKHPTPPEPLPPTLA